MKISVIIPTWNRDEILKSVLISLTDQTIGVSNFEVIVVDSNSDDNTVKYINNYNKILNINLINSPSNIISTKRNIGAKCAKYDLLVFIDDDVIPHSELLQDYITLQTNSYKTIFVGLTIFPIEKEQSSNYFRYRNNNYKKLLNYNNKIPPHLFTSMNYSIWKKDFIALGMFDESITKYGGEDLEFPLRLVKNLYKIKLSSHKYSIHKEPNSTLENRMNKVYSHGVSINNKITENYTSYTIKIKINLLNPLIKEDKFNTIIIKTLVYIFLSDFFAGYVMKFLSWSDRHSFLFISILYKYIYSYSYYCAASKIRYRYNFEKNKINRIRI